MFKIIKNIKIVPVIIKWLKLFCLYNSYEIRYGGRIYNLYVDAVIVSVRCLLSMSVCGAVWRVSLHWLERL